jgi:hypothetical protein
VFPLPFPTLGFLISGRDFFYGGKDVTPLVLLLLKLEHDIISIGIAYV